MSEHDGGWAWDSSIAMHQHTALRIQGLVYEVQGFWKGLEDGELWEVPEVQGQVGELLREEVVDMWGNVKNVGHIVLLQQF